MMNKSLYRALAFTIAFIIKAESCDVGVSPPWERTTYVPHNSSIRINCTANSSVYSPVWSILLSGTTAITQFSFERSIMLLNSRGFYELVLPETQTGTLNKTIQLLINSTEGNNGTLIMCNDVVSATLFSKTILIIYEASSVTIDTEDIDLQAVNISWSPLSQSVYTLTIVNSSSTAQPQILQLYQPYYAFTAPEGAPPCEVYNFSVTASYDIVGATYTGAGCSVPSQVISRMLPSLPDINPLRSSIKFLLEKHSNGIVLTTSFEIATYCEMYPVTNYTLKIKQLSTGSDVQELKFMSATNHIIANDLLENVIYMLQITAWNSVGSVSSDAVKVHTTDVQKVIVTPMKLERGDLNVTCHFLAGSDALGCVVILIGQSYNHTMKLMKRSADTVHTEVLKLKSKSLSCYDRIVAFDIESDGSTGILPIPGYLESTTDGPCRTNEVTLITLEQSGSKRVTSNSGLLRVVFMISVHIVSSLFNRS